MKLLSVFVVCVFSQEDGSKCKETALNMACVTECNIAWGACQARGLHLSVFEIIFLYLATIKKIQALENLKLMLKAEIRVIVAELMRDVMCSATW